jgi:hypothetical protein
LVRLQKKNRVLSFKGENDPEGAMPNFRVIANLGGILKYGFEEGP